MTLCYWFLILLFYSQVYFKQSYIEFYTEINLNEIEINVTLLYAFLLSFVRLYNSI